MNELVKRLTKKGNKVATERSKNVTELKEQIDREFVLIKFTETKGGTELGYKIDPELSNFEDANFDEGRGSVLLAGELTLNYEKVRCVAKIDLTTLTGKGHLELISAES